MSQVIDVHNHVIPAAFVDAVRRQPDKLGSHIEGNADGVEFDVQDSGRAIRVSGRHSNMDVRLKDMDEARIDVAVTSLLPPMFRYAAPIETGVRPSRFVNEAIAEDAAPPPGRVLGLAIVPLHGVR